VTPRVSVLMVTCDHDPWIAEAIESALAQDHPHLEIVVADDASDDRTPEIVRSYANRYPDLVKPVLHTGDRGAPENDNRGLARCTGEYIALVDGDDVFLPGKISTQVAAMEASPWASVCHHAVELFDDLTGRHLGIARGDPRLTAARDLVAHGNFVTTCSSLFRREAVPDHGFRSELRFATDWLFGIETALNGGILYVDSVLARYRQHARQMTNPLRQGSPVYRDTLLTLDLVEREHPELATEANAGRIVVHRWEAERRADAGLSPSLISEPIAAERNLRGGWKADTAAFAGRMAARAVLAPIRRRARAWWWTR
jgi:glycosyltransferase involved in cell wall biosynthesis